MSVILLEHLVFASLGVGVIAVLALLVQLVLGDAVQRYRILRFFLPALALVVPVQIIAVELAPQSLREWAKPSPPFPPNWESGTLTLRPESVRADKSGADGAETLSKFASNTAHNFVFDQITPATWLSLYASGMLISLALCSFRMGRAIKVLRCCRPVMDRGVREHFDCLARSLGLPRVRLLTCDVLSAPACWGFWRPAVILPSASVTPGSSGQLHCVLRHELVHLQRRDPLVAMLQMLVSAVFWFHPVVWLYGRALDRERELSCDALVVRATGKPKTYALTLLEYCERRGWARLTQRLDATLARFGSVVSLERRLKMIGRAQVESPRSFMRIVLAVVVLCASGSMVGHAAVAALMGPAAIFRPPVDLAEEAEGIDIDVTKQSAGTIQEVEVRPLPHGRGPGDVLQKYRLVFGLAADARFREGAWLTDQETIVSAHQARVSENVLEADEFLLNLPEGSNLTAVLRGEEISIEKLDNGLRIAIRDGEIRLIDPSDVARAVARVKEDRGPQTGPVADLILETLVEHDEIVFRARAVTRGGSRVAVRVTLDLTSGIPEEEGQPPHGAIRYWLRQPEHDGEPVRLKMQWIYDLSQLQRQIEELDETEETSRALELMSEGRVREALVLLDHSLGRRPDDWQLHRARAEVLGALGLHDEQCEAIMQALSLAPDSAETFFELGMMLLGHGRAAEASAAFDRALALNPNLAEAHLYRGVAVGDDQEALRAFQRALELRPNHGQAHQAIGEALQTQGRYEEALEAFEQAAKFDPYGRPPTHQTREWELPARL